MMGVMVAKKLSKSPRCFVVDSVWPLCIDDGVDKGVLINQDTIDSSCLIPNDILPKLIEELKYFKRSSDNHKATTSWKTTLKSNSTLGICLDWRTVALGNKISLKYLVLEEDPLDLVYIEEQALDSFIKALEEF